MVLFLRTVFLREWREIHYLGVNIRLPPPLFPPFHPKDQGQLLLAAQKVGTGHFTGIQLISLYSLVQGVKDFIIIITKAQTTL